MSLARKSLFPDCKEAPSRGSGKQLRQRFAPETGRQHSHPDKGLLTRSCARLCAQKCLFFFSYASCSTVQRPSFFYFSLFSPTLPVIAVKPVFSARFSTIIRASFCRQLCSALRFPLTKSPAVEKLSFVSLQLQKEVLEIFPNENRIAPRQAKMKMSEQAVSISTVGLACNVLQPDV